MGATSWYVCERNDEVVAVIQWRNLGEEEEILDIAVHAEHRRQGIARLLLEDFVRVSREHGVRNIFLEVRESNSAAAALYHKAGFSVIARRPNYYRDPVEAALVLRFEVPSG
jgi:ribosomal-protein-alanine N-acetyltransferase